MGFFVFSIFFGLFRNSLFQLFRFYTETETFDVSIEPKLTEDPPKQFIRENLGLFRFGKLCLFRLFRYRFETPKQTEIFGFWFHETNRNKPETDLVSVCFGSNPIFFFVSRTPYFGVLHHFDSHRYSAWILTRFLCRF